MYSSTLLKILTVVNIVLKTSSGFRCYKSLKLDDSIMPKMEIGNARR